MVKGRRNSVGPRKGWGKGSLRVMRIARRLLVLWVEIIMVFYSLFLCDMFRCKISYAFEVGSELLVKEGNFHQPVLKNLDVQEALFVCGAKTRYLVG